VYRYLPIRQSYPVTRQQTEAAQALHTVHPSATCSSATTAWQFLHYDGDVTSVDWYLTSCQLTHSLQARSKLIRYQVYCSQQPTTMHNN